MVDTVQKYGFIGLGAMGWHMAYNLRSKLPQEAILSIYDISTTITQKFAAEFGSGRVSIAQDAAQVVTESDIIFTIVPEGKHVRAVFSQDKGGTLSVDIRDKLFVECSTIDVETSQLVCKQIESRNATFIDAPVSGGSAGAEKGTLTFMVGVADSHPRLEMIRAILEMMGENIFACGGPTLGLATKICNNYISGTIAIATAEGMNLAMNLGLNPKIFSDVLRVSTGGSYINSHCNPVPGVDPSAPASKDYAAGFKVQLMRKDYNLAIEAAKASGSKLYLGDAGLNVYTQASADPDCVDRDSRVVYRFIGGREKW